LKEASQYGEICDSALSKLPFVYILYHVFNTREGALMALSIRNPRAEKLARQIAAESGESLTEVIIHALEERLQRLKGQRNAADVAEEIIKISLRCKALLDKDQRSADEILNYDERGLPR
jgi:antitoxin VapB